MFNNHNMHNTNCRMSTEKTLDMWFVLHEIKNPQDLQLYSYFNMKEKFKPLSVCKDQPSCLIITLRKISNQELLPALCSWTSPVRDLEITSSYNDHPLTDYYNLITISNKLVIMVHG